MSYITIIAEKPSVAVGIAKIVGAKKRETEGTIGYIEGNGYRVTWGFGHLVGLKSPEQIDGGAFGQDTLPMFPENWETEVRQKKNAKNGKYETDGSAKKQLEVIEKLFNGCTYIIVATDAGREGELIFRYIYEHLGCRTPFKRLWISSLTDEAIRKGLKEIKDGSEYETLSQAAHARSEADWLVGYNASRALRIASGSKVKLSLGRVQTPVLGMICERYEQNVNFTPVPYWVLKMDTGTKKGRFGATSTEQFDKEVDALKLMNDITSDGTATVKSVKKERKSYAPPYLYDLTNLQKAANSKYGMTAQQTLDIAQELYVNKLITYPRTGSRFIPEDVFSTIPALIDKFRDYGELGKHAQNLSGKKLCRKSVDDSKVTDHHALLPTGILPGNLKDSEKKIYNLICSRMLESFGENSTADVTTVLLEAGAEKTEFKARGSVPVSLGWKAVNGGDATESKKDDDEDDRQSIPELNEGQTLHVDKIESVRKETKPKPIFTDSTLLGEMETCGKNIEDEEAREAMKDVGLGTPATRAATIENLLQRGYVKRENRKLIPEELGKKVWSIVKGKRISDVATTGEWERQLALVEQGKLKADDFNNAIKKFTLEIIEDMKNFTFSVPAASNSDITCPFCGQPMNKGKKGWWCSCKAIVWFEQSKKKLTKTMLKELARNGCTSYYDDFVSSKTGKNFKARLILDKETKRVILDYFKYPEYLNKVCPNCHKELKNTPYSLKCDCGFNIYKTFSGAELTESDIDKLLKLSPITVKGCKKKNGEKYDGKICIIPKTGKIIFAKDKA